MSFTSHISEIRDTYQLTQQELADKIHTSRDCVSYWETGKRLIPMDKAILIADTFNVTVDYVLGRSDCTSVDNEYIHQQLGLSDNAINKLRTMAAHDKCLIESNKKNQKRIAAKKDKSSVRPLLLPLYTDTVNFLIESKLFFNLISTLSYFLNSDRFSKFLDSHFKKIDTNSLYPADENFIAGGCDIPINGDTNKALAKNLLDIQLNKLSEEFKKKAAAKK